MGRAVEVSSRRSSVEITHSRSASRRSATMTASGLPSRPLRSLSRLTAASLVASHAR